MKNEAQLPPGRELDALIAEKVMGWTNICGEQSWMAGVHPESKLPLDVPCYSTDISAAWDVVEKLVNLGDAGQTGKCSGFGFRLEHHTECSEDKWSCSLPTTVISPPYEEMNPDWVVSEGVTAPHSICLAALKAVMDVE